MRISDWSSDVCSSDLGVCRGVEERTTRGLGRGRVLGSVEERRTTRSLGCCADVLGIGHRRLGLGDVTGRGLGLGGDRLLRVGLADARGDLTLHRCRSEEHTSELQSLMRSSYALFCLKKKKPYTT